LRGSLFAVIDEAGYAGMIRLTREQEGPCSHCPGPEVYADLVSGRGPSKRDESRAVAIGPIDHPPTHATYRIFNRDLLHATSSDWQVVRSVDLDGDGRPDLEDVARCKRWFSSACVARQCIETCSGTRTSEPSPGEVKDVDCGDGIWDFPDCEPNAH
jgi:hypothetical protein